MHVLYPSFYSHFVVMGSVILEFLLLLLMPQCGQLQEVSIVLQATEMHSINSLSPEDRNGDISQYIPIQYVSHIYLRQWTVSDIILI